MFQVWIHQVYAPLVRVFGGVTEQVLDPQTAEDWYHCLNTFPDGPLTHRKYQVAALTLFQVYVGRETFTEPEGDLREAFPGTLPMGVAVLVGVGTGGGVPEAGTVVSYILPSMMRGSASLSIPRSTM